jgi:hypothetical protein
MQIGPPNVVGPLEIGKFSYSRAWPAHRSLTHFLSAHGPTAATARPSCHPRPATAWPRLPTTTWSHMAIARPCSLRCLPLPTRARPPLDPTCPLLGPTCPFPPVLTAARPLLPVPICHRPAPLPPAPTAARQHPVARAFDSVRP